MPELLVDYDKEAMAEIQRALDDMGKGSQRVAMSSALSAAEAMLAAIRAAAPYDSGTLRKGLVLHAEHNRRKGKQVYDVWPTPRLNYHFQKQVINPSPGKRTTAYYPASQNYGFDIPRRAGKEPPKRDHVDGIFFMEHTMQTHSEKARETVLREVEKHIDEAWGGK